MPSTHYQKVHIIVNPAAGRDEPFLKTLNDTLNRLEVDWEIFITKQAGDATRFAQAAVEAGVNAVAAYGGDGTVREVASGLRDSQIPLLILPGGTANVLSIELGIPRDFSQAISLLDSSRSTPKAIDMGMVGDQAFFHLGMGLEAEMNKEADREAKNRNGIFAYVNAALKNLRNFPTTHYHLELDGEKIEIDGINCMVTTFGSVGVGELKLSHAIDVGDGLLDVLVVQEVNLRTVLSAAAGAVFSGELAGPLQQWQVRKASIIADPPQPIVCDGELVKFNKIDIQVLPKAVTILVPNKKSRPPVIKSA
ncbi:MAG: diacylglycerol kinase family lipid kinase [Anaerolineae bacterium]|nr:MAG: diacylglycerol kinase family lipid kinase [Anaerolineae bacterium]